MITFCSSLDVSGSRPMNDVTLVTYHCKKLLTKPNTNIIDELCPGGGRTLNVEVIGMLVGNLFGKP